MLQNVTWFLFCVPHLEHITVGSEENGLTAIDGAAALAGGAELVESLQVAALALPVADGVADELERGDAAEIRDREDGVEDRLKAGIFALLRKHVHLEEALVGILLDFDQIRDLDRGPDLRKIDSFSRGNRFGVGHFRELLLNDNRLTRGRTTPCESAYR